MVKLGSVAEVDREGIDPSEIEPRSQYVGLEHIDSDGSLANAPVVDRGDLASTKFRFSRRHVLFGKLRPYLRKVARPSFDGICSTDIIPILPTSRVDRNYLFHFLRTDAVINRAARLSVGMNLPRINPRDLLQFEIPLPSLDEQRRIAAILDQADDLRRTRRLALEKLNALPQAIFQEMFGDPIANPRGLPTELLGSSCRLVRGSSPRPQGDPRFFGGPVPRLMIADVTRDGMVAYPKIDSLTLEGARRSRLLPRGTVVMAVSGAVGLPAILGIDACIHDGFVGFPDLDERISPSYLYYWLQSQRGLNSSRAPGAIWTNLTTDQVSAFSIAIPPSRAQESFEHRLSSLSSIVTNMTMHAKTLAALFGSLQHDAFSGTLDPSNAAATLTSLQRATHATPLAV